jgi:hypothetical protein
MVIRRIGPMSLARIAGTLYAVLGLLVGAVFSLFAMAGVFAAAGADAGPLPMLFGTAAILIFPIFYGCLGFVGALIAASLYNVLAGTVGGVELDVN